MKKVKPDLTLTDEAPVEPDRRTHSTTGSSGSEPLLRMCLSL